MAGLDDLFNQIPVADIASKLGADEGQVNAAISARAKPHQFAEENSRSRPEINNTTPAKAKPAPMKCPARSFASRKKSGAINTIIMGHR